MKNGLEVVRGVPSAGHRAASMWRLIRLDGLGSRVWFTASVLVEPTIFNRPSRFDEILPRRSSWRGHTRLGPRTGAG